MPQLWANIYANHPKSEGDAKIFELWLQRSAGPDGTYPLTLTMVQDKSEDQDIPAQSFVQVISLAVLQHHRWRHVYLDLYGDSEPFFKPLYTNVAPLPTLRGIQLRLREWDRDGFRQIIGILCSSPALERVEFGANCFNSNYAQSTLDVVPWDHPIRFDFIVLQPVQLFHILSSSMDTLQQISVSYLIFPLRIGGSTPIRHMTMHRLRFIRIKSFRLGGFASEVFENLTLPSLRHLHLPEGFGGSSELQTRGWDSLLSLLERSNCKLQDFMIGNIVVPELTEYLKSSLFEHLTTLRVTALHQHPDVSLRLVDTLSEACEQTQRPRMLPRLETLILDSVSSVEDVRRMVSDRVAAYGGYDKSKLRRVSAELVGDEFSLEMDLTSQNHARRDYSTESYDFFV
jgi:hypothetical protein